MIILYLMPIPLTYCPICKITPKLEAQMPKAIANQITIKTY